MHPDELLDAIKREGAAFAATLEGDDLAAVKVPSCPDWTLEELTAHLGRVHRWAAGIVRTHADERPSFPPRPETVTKTWFEDGVDELTTTLAEADPESTAWNFLGRNDGVRFWFRRQAQETVMHRCDAQLARNALEPVDTELAIDGVDELLDNFTPFLVRDKGDLGGTIHLHATDSPHGEWLVRCEAGEVSVGHGHEKGDAALRGTASDLLLWLWRRVDLGTAPLEVFGERSLIEGWHEVLSTP